MLNTANVIYLKLMTSIVFHTETQKHSYRIRSKTRVSSIILVIQHFLGDSRQYNNTRKK